MTYLEKYRLDHPFIPSKDIDLILGACPDDNSGGCPKDFPPEGTLKAACTACWNRQIPGTEEPPWPEESPERG